MYRPGRKRPIEGAPYATWSVRTVVGSEPAEVTETFSDGIHGTRLTQYATAHRDYESKQIIVTVASDHAGWVRGRNEDFALSRFVDHRDDGTLFDGFEPNDDAVLSGKDVLTRCDLPGCEHPVHVGDERHRAHDMSCDDYELCLRFDDASRSWRVHLYVSHRGTLPAGIAAGLASDLNWLVAEGRKMNAFIPPNTRTEVAA